jgi:dTDP-4-dehydrorhamnose 3,5-epimerase
VESYRVDRWREAGIDVDFVQDNHSLSSEAGVVRGMHFQRPPHAQAKLIRCTHGSVLDVAVDIRAGSPWFGKHVAVVLSAENGCQLYVPAGFAHGFCTLEPNSELQYKVSDYYAPDCDAGIMFDDSALGIDWPVAGGKAILSDKDRRLPKLADLPDQFVYTPKAG